MIGNIIMSVPNICMCTLHVCVYTDVYTFLLHISCVCIPLRVYVLDKYIYVCVRDYTAKYSTACVKYQPYQQLKQYFIVTLMFNCNIYIVGPNLTRTLSMHMKMSPAAALYCRGFPRGNSSMTQQQYEKENQSLSQLTVAVAH